MPALIEGAEEVCEYPVTDVGASAGRRFWEMRRIRCPVGSNGASQAILVAAAIAEGLTENPNLEIAPRA